MAGTERCLVALIDEHIDLARDAVDAVSAAADAWEAVSTVRRSGS